MFSSLLAGSFFDGFEFRFTVSARAIFLWKKKKYTSPRLPTNKRSLIMAQLFSISRHQKPSHRLFIEPFMLSLQHQILHIAAFLHSYRWLRYRTRRLRRLQHGDPRHRGHRRHRRHRLPRRVQSLTVRSLWDPTELPGRVDGGPGRVAGGGGGGGGGGAVVADRVAGGAVGAAQRAAHGALELAEEPARAAGGRHGGRGDGGVDGQRGAGVVGAGHGDGQRRGGARQVGDAGVAHRQRHHGPLDLPLQLRSRRRRRSWRRHGGRHGSSGRNGGRGAGG